MACEYGKEHMCLWMQTKINNKEDKDHLRQHHLADPIARGERKLS